MRHLTTYRVSVPKFKKMCAAGVFDGEKVELLDGVLTRMTTNPPHDFVVSILHQLLEGLLPKDKWAVREEKPIKLGRFWMPEPDLAIVRGSYRDYIARHPIASDIGLIVEVSDTTYAKDTKIKLRRYERSGIPYYWVVDLSRRLVEVRVMGGQGLSVPVHYSEIQEVPVVLDGQEFGRIRVRDLLP